MAALTNLAYTQRTGLGGAVLVDLSRHNGPEAAHRQRGHERR